MKKPRIHVLALGGTIAMVQGEKSVRPGLLAENLISVVPELSQLANFNAETVSKLGSFDLTLDSLLKLATHIQDISDRSIADGVVITQGTDTLEETAFLLDVVLDVEIPVVVIGAMRNPLMISADGPGNLLAAVRTIISPEVSESAEKLGVLVTMLDTIHTARHVAKTDSSRIDAFSSPPTGPMGVLVEDRVHIHMYPDRNWKIAFNDICPGKSPAAMQDHLKQVGLLTVGLDESGGFLRVLCESEDMLGYDGLVLAAMGGGHIPGCLTDYVSAIASRVPVVITSRAGSGVLLRKTYEMIGAEIDLANRGTINAGSLPPLKARILLTLTLMAKAKPEQIKEIFSMFN